MYFLLITTIALICLVFFREACPLSYQDSWSKFIVVPAKLSVPARDQELDRNSIPRTIIQTNERDYIPFGMAKATDALLKNNPEYSYRYFTDDTARSYIEDHYHAKVLGAYDKLIPGAYKADLFRYCFLNEHGGVYIDMGMIPGEKMVKLDDIIEKGDIFVSPEDNGTGRIYNAFMASAPNNPILTRAIELIVDNVSRKDHTKNSLDITGPGLLARAFYEVTGKRPSRGLTINGIHIIEFYKYLPCESGSIKDGTREVLFTKYPGYRKDQEWYNTNPHYSILWRTKRVFA
jgi:hypothetical protein